MRTRIVLGFAVCLLSAACTGEQFVGGDGGGDTGGDAGNVPPNHGGGTSDAGDAGETVDAVAPPGCDTTKLPTDDACVVNDAEGVFVSSTLGSPSGNGTKASPLASLDAAIAAAKKSNKRVYACAETYAEQVHFQDGVDVFGYFACNSAWTVVPTSHAKVAAPASPAATASNITTATRVEAVDLFAPDFTANSQSSIALVATTSPALVIKNATIHAGTGGKGADGTNGIKLQEPQTATKNGSNARPFDVCTGAIGHCLTPIPESIPGATNTCGGEAGHDPGPGGAGGWDGAYVAQLGSWNPWGTQSWTNGYPTAGGSLTTQGGTTGVAAVAGAKGTDGVAGASGVAFGALSATGYAAADGTAGADGAPGQGGGGAAGQWVENSMAYAPSYDGDKARGEAGASGGAGGCPGLAATPGKGGGASIAIVAIASPFTLDTVTVETSAGGSGGKSGDSSTNTSGGKGGQPAQYTRPAAAGGDGGFAGVSGNGGGGPSIGVAYQGTAPTQLAGTVKVGSGGSGVAARTDAGNGKSIPASPDGLSANSYAF